MNVINKISTLINVSQCTASSHCGTNGSTKLTCNKNICSGLNSPCVALWTGCNIIKAALNKNKNIIGENLFEYYNDNQPNFPISDDILWWGLVRNLAFSYTNDETILSSNFQILKGFMNTWSPVCGGGVVWGCLSCAYCSDAQKNAVTNQLTLLNALELLTFGLLDKKLKINTSTLKNFCIKEWNWLKQATNGVAGLVDYKNGIVYDKFRPILSTEKNASSLDNLPASICCAGGCENENDITSYNVCSENYSNGVGCGAINPNTGKQYWAKNQGQCINGQSACGLPDTVASNQSYNYCTVGWANYSGQGMGADWPSSWETPATKINAKGWLLGPVNNKCSWQGGSGGCCATLKKNTSINDDCSANSTYNQGLLIGCMIQMDILNKYGVSIDNLNFINIAIKAFNFTVNNLSEKVDTYGLIISDGDFVKKNGCWTGDNFWFRSIFYWNSLKLLLYLKKYYSNSYKSDINSISTVLTNNWKYVKAKVINQNSLAANNWFLPNPGAASCIKTQISLSWLAITSIPNIDDISSIILYTSQPGTFAPGTPSPGPGPGPTPTPTPTPSGCPGNSLVACIGLCPSNPPIAYQACVQACVKRCSQIVAQKAPAPRTPAPSSKSSKGRLSLTVIIIIAIGSFIVLMSLLLFLRKKRKLRKKL